MLKIIHGYIFFYRWQCVKNDNGSYFYNYCIWILYINRDTLFFFFSQLKPLKFLLFSLSKHFQLFLWVVFIQWSKSKFIQYMWLNLMSNYQKPTNPNSQNPPNLLDPQNFKNSLNLSDPQNNFNITNFQYPTSLFYSYKFYMFQ